MFAIWLLPNKKDTEYLQRIINKLSLEFNSPKFIPHITIHGLIDLDLEKIHRIVEESICGCLPFDVYKKRIEESDQVWKSLFISFEKSRELSLINNKLKKDLCRMKRTGFHHTYHYHTEN